MSNIKLAFSIYVVMIVAILCIPISCYALDVSDTGFAWNDASHKERWEVCKEICNRLQETEGGECYPTMMYDCIENVFSLKTAAVLKETIASTGAWCYLLDYK